MRHDVTREEVSAYNKASGTKLEYNEYEYNLDCGLFASCMIHSDIVMFHEERHLVIGEEVENE